jgi:hypothetical protein
MVADDRLPQGGKKVLEKEHPETLISVRVVPPCYVVLIDATNSSCYMNAFQPALLQSKRGSIKTRLSVTSSTELPKDRRSKLPCEALRHPHTVNLAFYLGNFRDHNPTH